VGANNNKSFYIYFNNPSAEDYLDDNNFGTRKVWNKYTNVYHLNIYEEPIEFSEIIIGEKDPSSGAYHTGNYGLHITVADDVTFTKAQVDSRYGGSTTIQLRKFDYGGGQQPRHGTLVDSIVLSGLEVGINNVTLNLKTNGSGDYWLGRTDGHSLRRVADSATDFPYGKYGVGIVQGMQDTGGTNRFYYYFYNLGVEGNGTKKEIKDSKTGAFIHEVGDVSSVENAIDLNYGRFDFNSSFNLSNTFTIEYWFNTERATLWRLLNSDVTFNNAIWHKSATTVTFASTDIGLSKSFLTNEWQKITFQAEGNLIKVLNAYDVVGERTISSEIKINRFGGKSIGSSYDIYQGLANEIRITNETLTDWFLKTTFYNQNSTSEFYSFGDIETSSNETDSCTYSGSGDWIINCSDNCVISSNVNMGNNNIIISGEGSFILNANITNWNELWISGISSNAQCKVYCIGGNCFK
jgi:hypothetical protein